MKNKIKILGIIALVAVIGFSMAGCASPPPNYYNFGSVSEENCAQIVVYPLSSGPGWTVQMTLEAIDGQADWYKWKHPNIPFAGTGKAIVRVEPGVHTFTAKYSTQSADPTIPISITYDCVAGMGYRFEIQSEGTYAKIVLYEAVVGENGEFGEFKVVAEQRK
jgi:hypothetical protein